jgi:guanyl-specific ribonuclease Sa
VLKYAYHYSETYTYINSPEEKRLDLTFGVVAIAITLVIVVVMNATIVPISIAYAINTSCYNSLSSSRISFATYGLTTNNTTTIPTISIDQLPSEALTTIKNIKNGGPFPFPMHDGSTFLNREGILPSKPSGYYKEYTVPTPDVHSRGPQRIITSQNGEMYYTPDHYNTFEHIIK